MKNYVFLFISVVFLCVSNQLTAQYQININAQVFDKTTRQSLSFVEVTFLNTAVKTITDANGKFALSYNESIVKKTDSVQFSADGYHTQKTSISQLYRLLKNTKKLYLYSKKQPISKRLDGTIYGQVFNNKRSLQGVSIKIKNTLIATQTDAEGRYAINAKKGDILRIQFLGMKPREVRIGNNPSLDIYLEADGTVLDEVIVKTAVKKEQLIDLGLGNKKSFDEIGFSVNIMTEKDIKPHYLNLQDILLGKFAGVHVGVSRPGEPPIVYLRPTGLKKATPAVFDIDGFVYEEWPYIDVQNIKSIVILKSLASTVKYGTLGLGGVIVIRTKTLSERKAIAKKKSALVTGNEYTEEVANMNTTKVAPAYVQLLQKATTFKEAKRLFKNLTTNNANHTISFFLDAAGYFFRWNTDFALAILANTTKLASKNAKALRTLAFKYEALGNYKEARLLYQKIAVLRPKDAQTYRDLALIYTKTGYYKESLQLYQKMLKKDSIQGVDFSGLAQPITNELMHLIALYKETLDLKEIPIHYKKEFKQDLRIVFEWNDSYAEFALQFVNPKKKFYTWSHTQFDNRKRMLKEIQQGYATQTYLIDDTTPGEWIINLEVFNEKASKNPNYLKYTVYKNYGLANETKRVKVIELQNIHQKVTLDRFNY